MKNTFIAKGDGGEGVKGVKLGTKRYNVEEFAFGLVVSVLLGE